MLRVGRPYFDQRDVAEITSRIAAVLSSGRLTSGEVVADFEKQCARVASTKYAISVSSCTAALHTLISVLNIRVGDEVIVPANTFVSTANAALYAGATPVFADCDLETFNVTAHDIERCITSKTRAVIVVHVAGNPCEMDDIVRLCYQRNLLLIEDCAHALGSTYRGRHCGTLGVAGALSFYPTKVITSGEGGMILTESDEVCEKAKLFRNVGRVGLGHGPVMMLGFNYRMSEIHACIALNQLKHLEEFLDKRKRLADIYDEGLRSIDWLKPQKMAGHTTCSYYAYICRLLPNSPSSRDALIEHLRRKGIESTVMYHPVHLQPYYSGRFKIKPCPNAELVGETSIVLPLHAGMNDDEVRLVTKSIRILTA